MEINQIKEIIKEKEMNFKNDTERKVYMFYVDNIMKKKRPTLEEIGQEFGITRQAVSLIMKNLKSNGYLVTIPRQENQELYLPHHWFNATT